MSFTCLSKKMLSYSDMVAQQYDARWFVKLENDIHMKPNSLALAMQQWVRMGAEHMECMKNGQLYNNLQSKWDGRSNCFWAQTTTCTLLVHSILSSYVIDSIILPNTERLRRLANQGACLAAVLCVCRNTAVSQGPIAPLFAK